jgi:hypothetical protein
LIDLPAHDGIFLIQIYGARGTLNSTSRIKGVEIKQKITG